MIAVSAVCQYTPCDCCEVYCERAATMRVARVDGTPIGSFCEEHAAEYLHDDDDPTDGMTAVGYMVNR